GPQDRSPSGGSSGFEEGHVAVMKGWPMRTAGAISRRQFLGAAGAALLTGRARGSVRTVARSPQRLCVVLFDGFGTDYYERSSMPTLKTWAREGFYKQIRAVMPTVTNTNMAGVCCGVHADEHGITGNSYWDADADQERFMSDGNLLTAATMFQRAARY